MVLLSVVYTERSTLESSLQLAGRVLVGCFVVGSSCCMKSFNGNMGVVVSFISDGLVDPAEEWLVTFRFW